MILILGTVLPFVCITIYLIFSLRNYSYAYDEIVSNMTIANSYNLNFKEDMDESLYKLVVGAVTFDNISGDRTLEDPYQVIGIQDDIQYYIYYQTQSIENLKVQLNDQVQKFIVLWTALLICLIVCVLLLSSVIANSITRPIRELCGVTRQISEGDFSARAGVKTQDEVSQLADSVNEMSKHLEVMVSQIKEDERKMRYAELRLLQEQINPHFLYNTLDTIIWLIEGNLSEQAVDMVVSLSDFFRLVLSHGKEFITIKDEELHIRSYLEIQQVRYHDILDYEISIEPALYPYRILKLTLQPLVENALYHGIKYKRAMGKITITGSMIQEEQERKICLCVKDNGVGMEEEELRRLQKEITRPCQETESGFGLANVNERLRMNFGMAYGLTILSEKGEGTEVRVMIPAQLMEDSPEGDGYIKSKR